MGDNAKMGWELLGFGLMCAGPVLGAVVVSNKSPATWSRVWGVAAVVLDRYVPPAAGIGGQVR